jgi:hypothetical protein
MDDGMQENFHEAIKLICLEENMTYYTPIDWKFYVDYEFGN